MRKILYRYLLSSSVLGVICAAGAVAAQTAQFPASESANTIEIASLLPASAPLSDVPAADPETASPLGFAAAPPVQLVVAPREIGPVHAFWDRENRILFVATGAAATADFFVTHANLANGGRELNPLVRPFAGSTPALATNFALETVGVIGLSYVFHKTGHHQLERVTSLVNIGSSSSAVVYGLAHR